MREVQGRVRHAGLLSTALHTKQIAQTLIAMGGEVAAKHTSDPTNPFPSPSLSIRSRDLRQSQTP